MSDLEERLRSVLSDRAEEAPAPVGLAQGARARLARRRRATVLVVGLAVALVAVPIGVLNLSRSPDRQPAPTTPSPDEVPGAVEVFNGWHTETWRDVEIQVPNTWIHGRLTNGCTSPRPATPVVERPGERMPLHSCGPVNGYGVQFVPVDGFDVGDSPGVVHRYTAGNGIDLYPDGAWVGVITVGGQAGIRVVARSEYVASYLLSSARRVGEVDSNGCEPAADLAMTDGVPVLQALLSVSAVSVCGYDVVAGPATLEPLAWSARLTGDAAQELLDSLKESALHANASARRCLRDPFGPAYLLRFGSERVWIRPVGSCPPDGAVVDGAQTRFLTPGILREVAALAPGAGGS
ncbi:hypothetical protein [Nocardioides sp.]|uniref:hypothetical protein n=1 Tax=Nocardioides sp. TaxID=35761 RepID=UPI003D0BCDFF